MRSCLLLLAAVLSGPAWSAPLVRPEVPAAVEAGTAVLPRLAPLTAILAPSALTEAALTGGRAWPGMAGFGPAAAISHAAKPSAALPALRMMTYP
ncbi:MAG: hypothetical protein KGK30_07420, partial [Elusimicrobia bacterium]|nr:hypothetical protein [Elusimicrobiota bacterium]